MNARALCEDLCSAILKGQTKEVSELLNALPNEKEVLYSLFSERNEAAHTPLMLAVTCGNADILRLLLAYLIPEPAMVAEPAVVSVEAAEIINLTDEEGNTALHLACSANNKACMDLLLAYQANPFIVNRYSQVPFEQITKPHVIARCAIEGFYIGMDLPKEYKALLEEAAIDVGCAKFPFLLVGTSIAGNLIKANEINFSVTNPKAATPYLRQLTAKNKKHILKQCLTLITDQTLEMSKEKIEVVTDFYRRSVGVHGSLQEYAKFVKFKLFNGNIASDSYLPHRYHYEVNNEIRKKINNLLKEFYPLWRYFLNLASSPEKSLTPIGDLFKHFFANSTTISPKDLKKVNEFLQSANALLDDAKLSSDSNVTNLLEEIKSHLNALSQVKLIDEVKLKFVKLDKSIRKLLTEVTISPSHHVAKRQFLS